MDITGEHALYGVEFIELAMKRTINAVQDQLADNEQEHLTKRVHRIISEFKYEGVTKSVLTKKTYFLKRKERDDIIVTLLESGQITCKEMKMSSKGFATNLYYSSKYV